MKYSFLDSIRFSTNINGTRLNHANQPNWRGCWARPVKNAEIIRVMEE
jgi:hypothetical protein